MEPHRQRYGFASLNNALYFGAWIYRFERLLLKNSGNLRRFMPLPLLCSGAFESLDAYKEPEEQSSDRSLRGMYAGQSNLFVNARCDHLFQRSPIGDYSWGGMASSSAWEGDEAFVGRFLTVLLESVLPSPAIAEADETWSRILLIRFFEIFGNGL